MRRLHYQNTLYYYDGPQVIELRDAIGGHYVGVLVDVVDGQDRYLCTGVAPERLADFRIGGVDLRVLMTEQADGSYLFATGELGAALTCTSVADAQTLSDSLPDPGFVLHEHASDDSTVAEARNRANFVLDLAVEPPEARGEHRIRSSTLIGLLQHVQTLIKHAYGAALRELKTAQSREIDHTDAHLLDVVVPAATGSFRIVLEAHKRADLLGHNELERAMERVDALFDGLDQPQVVLERVKAHKGHLSGAFLRLLRFLVEQRTGLRYQWATPNATKARRRAVSEAQSSAIVELLSGVSNLASEPILLVGVLEEADCVRGKWRLATEDAKEIGTVTDGGPSLEGLKLGGRYRFDCVEVLDAIDATGRESRRIYLTDYSPAAD